MKGFLKDRLTLLSVIIIIALTSCKQRSVDGIIIGGDLYEHSYFENKKLCGIIKRGLKKDKSAFLELVDIPCGGAAGCYDVGFVLTQVINRISAEEFIRLTAGFTLAQKQDLLNHIEVGIEYGDSRYNGSIKTKYTELKTALTP